MKKAMLSWFIVFSATHIAALHAAEEGVFSITISKSAASSRPKSVNAFYLAPELVAAAEAKANVVGVSSNGQLLVKTGSPADLLKSAFIASTEKFDVDTEAVNPIRLMIGFKNGTENKVKQKLEQSGFKIVKASKRAKYLVVEPDAQKNGTISPDMITALKAEVSASGARSATPNFKITLPKPNRRRAAVRKIDSADTTPNDPQFSQLWGMININAPKAWDVATSSPVVVAVIDTGIDHNHPDLKANIWQNLAEVNGTAGVDDDSNGFVDDFHGWDFANDDNSVFDDANVDDHGTHVAGTIGAVGNNSQGVAGVNWQVQIMAVKFLNPSGSLDDAVDSIFYAIDNGAEIFNNSWSGGGFSPVLENAIQQANANGILFVAAADNDGNDNDQNPSFPSMYDVPNVIAVGSIDEPVGPGLEERSFFSSFGATSVDLFAPGGDIVSTVPGGGLTSFDGTSMATPHVAGALALMRGVNEFSSLSHLELRQKLLDEARPANALTGLCVTEATLDIAFLSGSEGCKPSGDSFIFSKTFGSGQVISETSDIIAELEIDLPSPAKLVATANTSGLSDSNDVLVDLQLLVNSATGEWTSPYRFVTLKNADSWTGLTISHSGALPAGKHVVRWIGAVAGGDVELDAGSIAVVAKAVAPNGANRLNSPDSRRSDNSEGRGNDDLRAHERRLRVERHKLTSTAEKQNADKGSRSRIAR